MKNGCGGHLTAHMLSQNFSEIVKSFRANDEAYHFMNTIKGNPVYWKSNPVYPVYCNSKTTRAPNIPHDIKLC